MRHGINLDRFTQLFVDATLEDELAIELRNCPCEARASDNPAHCRTQNKGAHANADGQQIHGCRSQHCRLLQIDRLIAPVRVELRTPYLVHSLVLGTAEARRRAEPNVEVLSRVAT